MRSDLYEGLITLTEFISQLGIDQKTSYNWHLRGYGPKRRRIVGRVYYVQAEVDAFVRELRDSERTPVVA